MGIELVEGSDLFVRDGYVLDAHHRRPGEDGRHLSRVDDAYMDPLSFNPDSALGVPGLLMCIRSGGVTLADALGAGVADDKAMYCYVPRMMSFYLGEHAILDNVHTYMLRDTTAAAARVPKPAQSRSQGSAGLRRLRHADRTYLDQRKSAKPTGSR